MNLDRNREELITKGAITTPHSREEAMLIAMATNSSGEGVTSFDELTGRPKYNGNYITSQTDIPRVPLIKHVYVYNLVDGTAYDYDADTDYDFVIVNLITNWSLTTNIIPSFSGYTSVLYTYDDAFKACIRDISFDGQTVSISATYHDIANNVYDDKWIKMSEGPMPRPSPIVNPRDFYLVKLL